MRNQTNFEEFCSSLKIDAREFKPIPGLKQVFGHTGLHTGGEAFNGIRSKKYNYNIDCVEWCIEKGFPIEVLELKDGKFNVVKFDVFPEEDKDQHENN